MRVLLGPVVSSEPVVDEEEPDEGLFIRRVLYGSACDTPQSYMKIHERGWNEPDEYMEWLRAGFRVVMEEAR